MSTRFLTPATVLAVLLLPGCASDTAAVNDLRRENADLRQRLAEAEGGRPADAASPELVTDLQEENRRLEQLAGLTAKGEAVASENALFSDTFDRASNRTTVLSRRLLAESTATLGFTRYGVAVGFRHNGHALENSDRPVDPILLLVETYGSPGSRLAAASEASLDVAGDRFGLRIESYAVLDERTSGNRGGRGRSVAAITSLDERLILPLSRETARAFARSNGAELELPGLTLRLTRKHAALARAALLRSE